MCWGQFSFRELVRYGRDRGEPLRPILTTIAVTGNFGNRLTPGSSESEARGVAGHLRVRGKTDGLIDQIQLMAGSGTLMGPTQSDPQTACAVIASQSRCAGGCGARGSGCIWQLKALI